jgi:hypothetical protein
VKVILFEGIEKMITDVEEVRNWKEVVLTQYIPAYISRDRGK